MAALDIPGPRPARAVELISRTFLVLAGLSIVALALVMLGESLMRYVFSAPLGWNVSAVERVFMPASVFLALPWLYLKGEHVAAELVYDRLPPGARVGARWLTLVVVLVTAGLLVVAGASATVDAFVQGDVPPPTSSELPIPTWMWVVVQPLGALALVVVVALDAPRALALDASPSEADLP